MANRYWVGGTADWDGTAGTKWATTSGGTGGASVPTSTDDVFLDANSGTGTVSIVSGNTGAASLNCTGFTGTLNGNAGITISGSVTLVSGMTFTYASFMTIDATGTFTSGGKSFNGGTIFVNGSGITVTLGDAFSTNINLIVIQGTLNTNGYNVTCGNLSSSNSNTRTLALSTSTLTLSGTSPVLCTTSTNLTVTGSATLKCTSSSPKTADLGSKSWANCTLDQAGSGALTIAGSNTLYDITNSYNSTGAATITFTSGTTTTLTNFTAAGTSGKVLTINATTTSAATLSKSSGTVSVDYMSISYSTATGGASWYAGANSTNGGNNSGWIFTAPPPPSTANFLMFF